MPNIFAIITGMEDQVGNSLSIGFKINVARFYYLLLREWFRALKQDVTKSQQDIPQARQDIPQAKEAASFR